MSRFRRDLDAVASRLKTEPTLWDVLTEGESDATFIQTVLQKSHRDAQVYCVDHLEVPSELCTGPDESEGARGRVLAACRILAGRIDNPPLVGVVDLDLRTLHLDQSLPPLVRATDFTSLDLYFYSSDAIERLVKLTWGMPQVDISALCQSLEVTLTELFLARACARRLAPQVKMPDPISCMIQAGDTVEFDADGLREKFLAKADKLPERESYKTVLADYGERAPEDPRRRIRGHDLHQVLAWWAKQLGVRPHHATPELVAANLRSHVDFDEMVLTDLFAGLIHDLPSR